MGNGGPVRTQPIPVHPGVINRGLYKPLNPAARSTTAEKGSLGTSGPISGPVAQLRGTMRPPRRLVGCWTPPLSNAASGRRQAARGQWVRGRTMVGGTGRDDTLDARSPSWSIGPGGSAPYPHDHKQTLPLLGDRIRPSSPQRAALMPTPHAPSQADPRSVPASSTGPNREPTTAPQPVLDNDPSLHGSAVPDARRSLNAVGMVCTPVLCGLLAPGGLVGLFLVAWLVFS